LKEETLDSVTITRRIAEVALERKALDVVVLDVRGRSSYTDFIVLASGTSDRHVQAVAELVAVTLSHQGVRNISREGLREGQWALIDFGSVILHVFHEFTRQVYNLEEMWHDAPRLTGFDEATANSATPQPAAWAPGP
jgi:ribosome-associated protein